MGLPPAMAPPMVFQSIGFTLAARTATRICPGPACGSGASPHSRTSGPPYALYCNARIQASFRRRSLIRTSAFRQTVFLSGRPWLTGRTGCLYPSRAAERVLEGHARPCIGWNVNVRRALAGRLRRAAEEALEQPGCTGPCGDEHREELGGLRIAAPARRPPRRRSPAPTRPN